MTFTLKDKTTKKTVTIEGTETHNMYGEPCGWRSWSGLYFSDEYYERVPKRRREK